MRSSITSILLLAVLPAAAQNLIQNPGCDLPLVSGEIPGWTEVTGNLWGPRCEDPIPFDGTCYFFAGAVAEGTLEQMIDLSAFATTIDAGLQPFQFKGWVRSWSQIPADQSNIELRFLDASQSTLTTILLGPYSETTTWQLVTSSNVAPIGTRAVKISLRSVRLSGANNDGYFDGLEFFAQPPIPSNDYCSNAMPLSLQMQGQCPSAGIAGSTLGATISAGNCFSWSDVWYAVTGGPGQAVTINLNPGTASNIGMQILTACPGAGSLVFCDNVTSHSFAVPAGETYYVRVMAQTPGTFTICAVAAPENNECAGAVPLVLQQPGDCPSAGIAGSTLGATISAGNCFSWSDVWYAVTGGPGQAVTINLNPGTASNIGMQILTACPGAGSQVFCDNVTSHSFAVPAGETYYVRVMAQTPGTFTICAVAAPENNECAGAVPLVLQQPGDCPSAGIAGSTLGATISAGNCFSWSDVWYAVTGGPGQAVTINLNAGTASNIGMQVLTACPGAGSQVFCNNVTSYSFAVPAGETYYVRVMAQTPGTFTICAVAAPENNECTGAVPLVLQQPGDCPSAGIAGSTLGATISAGNCFSWSDVWYAVTGGPGQAVTINLNAVTASNIGMQVLTACPGAGSQVFCNNVTSYSFAVPAGETYYVRVMAQTPGTFTICAVAAPENNECAGAVPLVLQQPGDCPSAGIAGSTLGATISAASCISWSDVWYAVTGGPSQTVTITLNAGTASNIGMQVLTACPGAGSQVFCNNVTSYSFAVPAGETYYVRVMAQTPGTFSICANSNSAFLDCLGESGGSSLPGTICNDNNPCTTNDLWQPNCSCAGTPLPDGDSDGLCDAEDDCPNLPGQVGSPCDDGSAQTFNDQLDAQCQCTGQPVVHDLELLVWNTPASACGLSATEQVSFTVRNNGNQPVSTFVVGFLLNGDTIEVIPYGGAPIPPGNVHVQVFGQTLDLSVLGTYNLQGFVLTGQDDVPSNDRTTVTVTHTPPINTTGTLQGLLPLNGTTNLQGPVSFSWLPVPYATRYDLYVWKSTQPVPTSPFVNNTSAINVTLTSPFDPSSEYRWKVVAKSACPQALESATQVFFTPLQADLTVEAIQVPAAPFSGQPVQVSWQVRNQGVNTTSSYFWHDRIYLSTDNVYDVLDTYVGAKVRPLVLGPGEAYTSSLNFTIPINTFGTWYVIVRTDISNAVQETNETNNLLAQLMEVAQTPPPDLVITNVVAPSSTISELSYPISWTVTNTGTGSSAASYWLDKVYLSPVNIFNPSTAAEIASVYRTGALASTGSYTVSTTVSIPQGYNGEYFLFVRTDVGNQVYEFTDEDNNISDPFPIQVVLQPPPDLSVQLLSVAPLVVNNQGSFTVQYRVTNIGASFAETAMSDRLYIGTNSEFTSGTTWEVGYASQTYGLQNGASIDLTISGQAPNNISGIFHVFLIVDHADQLFEYTFEANNTATTSGLVIQHADLAVVSASTPATAMAGSAINVQWGVSNIGPGGLLGVPRQDAWYLNDQPDLQNATPIGSSAFDDTHPANSLKQRSRTIALPVVPSGTYYLIVRTDDGGQVFENGSEENNVWIVPVQLSEAQLPDLAIASVIAAPGPITAGQQITATYAVINQGLAPVQAQTWTDRIYVSSSPSAVSTDAVLVGTLELSTYLEIGGTYSRTVNFTIPILLAAQPPVDLFLILVADVSNQILEIGPASNNTGTSSAIATLAPPPVELEVLSAQLNATTVFPGASYPITFTVRNNGTSNALWNMGSWSDAIYLSSDPVWGNDDQLIASAVQSSAIGTGQSYTRVMPATIPYTVSGGFYLILVADRTSATNDPDQLNNRKVITLNGQGTGVPITVPVLSYPDLSLTTFSVPNQGIAGQGISVSWSVSNIGDSTAHGASVLDRVVLSTDQILGNTNDVVLSSLTADLIGPGGSYSRSVMATLPLSAVGNYYVLVATDALGTEYENGSETNNIAAGVINIVQSPPGDLIVTDVIVPPNALVGSSVDITYRVENIGSNPVEGSMQEVIFLSADAMWDNGDALLTSATVSVDLAPGASVWRTVSGVVPGLEAGTYRAIVQTDAFNSFLENSETNNRGVSLNAVSLDMPLLVLDVPQAFGLPIAASRYFRLHIPEGVEGETVLITLTTDALAGGNELHVRYGEAPTRAAHDQSSSVPNQQTQQVLIPDVSAGDHYILVYGLPAASGAQNVSLLATVIPFQILSVTSNIGGNTGNCTVEIQGARFSPATAFSLAGPGGTILASSTYYIGSTRVFATFPLAGASLGLYDLQATDPGPLSDVLSDAFTIVQGSPVAGGFGGPGSSGGSGGGGFNCSITAGGGEQDLGTLFTHPSVVTRNSVFNVLVQWSYSGTVDIPTPSKLVLSLNQMPIAPDVAGLSAENTEIQLQFSESNGPPGILRPGSSGSIPFVSRATNGLGELRFLIVD